MRKNTTNPDIQRAREELAEAQARLTQMIMDCQHQVTEVAGKTADLEMFMQIALNESAQ